MTKEDALEPRLIASLIEEKNGRYYWKDRTIEFFKSDKYRKTWNTRFSGTETFVSYNHKGYKYARILGLKYLAHRVIWALHYGEWPKGQIDHINGNRDDNDVKNLRVVSVAENNKNASLSAKNTSGVNGVYARGKRWVAQININKKTTYIGTFESKDAAFQAYEKAKLENGYHPNHGKGGYGLAG